MSTCGSFAKQNLVILQGPTWFDAHRVLGIKTAARDLGYPTIIYKSTKNYDIAGIDNATNFQNFPLEKFNSHPDGLIWSSSEELASQAHPNSETFRLGIDKSSLRYWLKKHHLPVLPGFNLNHTEIKKYQNLKGPFFIKPKTGRGAIAKKPWHYQIVNTLDHYPLALDEDDSVVEVFTGSGPESVFYDVHVWFGASNLEPQIFLVAQWVSADDGRIKTSFGPVKMPPCAWSVVTALASAGFQNSLANLQFAEYQGELCLIDFNTRSAGVWALIQPEMCPDFYKYILQNGSLPHSLFRDGFTHYYKTHFDLQPGQVIESIKIPANHEKIKNAYSEKLVRGYTVPSVLNSLQPNPQVASFGSSLNECLQRLSRFNSSLEVIYSQVS